MFNMNNFGKHLQIKQKGKKKPNPNTKKTFVEIVKTLCNLDKRSFELEDKFGLIFQNYEEEFYLTIESLLYLIYDDWKVDLILWYVYAGDIEGEPNILYLKDEETEEETEVEINSPEELYDFIKKHFKK